MTVKEIVIKYLKENGYDGLYSDDCGCLLDDLMPCSDCGSDLCEAGVKKNCDKCENKIDGVCSEDADFCIGERIETST